ncbi:MAG: SIMPL domain-containing protein [Chloroflexota bacterium]
MIDPARPAGTIVVSGTGRVAVDPDVADLRLGVAISRPTVAAARTAAAEAMTAILTAVTDAGVARRDVRTSVLSVQPRYDYRDGKAPTLTGYDLANVVEVTVRDLATLGAVVDGALAAGATSLDALTFRVDDPREAEHAARTAAVVEARARADVLAAASGVTIAGVSDVVEGGQPPQSPQPKATRMLTAADTATPVEGGTTEIAVTVTVTFRIA